MCLSLVTVCVCVRLSQVTLCMCVSEQIDCVCVFILEHAKSGKWRSTLARN